MIDILFVTPMDKAELRHEVNGTLLLATLLLQADFQTDILRFCQDENCRSDYAAFVRGMTEKILAREPSAVSFYTLWPSYHIMLRIASEIKKIAPHIPIIMGGPQASATAEETMTAMPFVDYICTGEGEHTVVPFFSALLRHRQTEPDHIPGLYYRKNGAVVHNDLPHPLCDLNSLPQWDDRLLMEHYEDTPEKYRSRTYFMPIDAGRGCPFNCTFCTSSRFWKRTYRMKSPEKIVADIRYYYDKFGIRSFFFSHDAFTVNKKLVEKVCDYIIEEKLDITWRCATRIDCITEEMAIKMKAAGLISIQIGIETGSPRMQKITNKKLDLTVALDKINMLLKQKLQVTAFLMYGFPEETREDLAQTLELAFKLTDMGIHDTSLGYTKFHPGTPITQTHLENLVMDPEIKVLANSLIFGYDQEVEMLTANRAIFPCYHHLSTDVRDNFQYVNYFLCFCHRSPIFANAMRNLYDNDLIQFYLDFARRNAEIVEDTNTTVRKIAAQTDTIVENLLRDRDLPYLPQLRSLAKYEQALQTFSRTREDISITETYDFLIMDLKRKLPIELYMPGKTTILMERTNGVKKIKVLAMG